MSHKFLNKGRYKIVFKNNLVYVAGELATATLRTSFLIILSANQLEVECITSKHSVQKKAEYNKKPTCFCRQHYYVLLIVFGRIAWSFAISPNNSVSRLLPEELALLHFTYHYHPCVPT